jgi:hypothetical protein
LLFYARSPALGAMRHKCDGMRDERTRQRLLRAPEGCNVREYKHEF